MPYKSVRTLQYNQITSKLMFCGFIVKTDRSSCTALQVVNETHVHLGLWLVISYLSFSHIVRNFTSPFYKCSKPNKFALSQENILFVAFACQKHATRKFSYKQEIIGTFFAMFKLFFEKIQKLMLKWSIIRWRFRRFVVMWICSAMCHSVTIITNFIIIIIIISVIIFIIASSVSRCIFTNTNLIVYV